ncbi:hypothetical protein [Streptomyces fradiae]|uniref:hypothetical protein n=1 Tax=Streptomyces fradiae TaxID=1906 RepID=UPI003986E73B
MALTYKKVMETDFGKLTTAAKAWDDMAGEFKKAESAYSAAVQGVKPNWDGVAFGAAYVNFAATKYEYGAAQKQAKAIADLLRDAHQQFTELKSRLTSLVADAVKDGMAVDGDGTVKFDTSKLSDDHRRAYHHDPDYQTSVRSAAASWAAQIKKYVTAFEDADSGVKLALEQAVKDSNKDFPTGKDATLNGFNAGAKGDVEHYELEYAKDVTTRLNNGEKVSDAEVQGLSRILRDNNNEAFKHRTEFGQTFLSSIGADGTIKLANTLNNVAHSGDSGRSGLFRDTNTALANTVSTATQVVFEEGRKNPPYGSKEYRAAFEKWSKTDDAKFYNSFMTELKKAGANQYDLDAAGDKISMGPGQDQKIRGYQGLVTLMQQGSDYAPQFLGDLADQMVEIEKDNKNIWDLYGKFEGKNDGWFANDPVDGVLRFMSRDPEVATGYLDPAANEGNDRLQYLLRGRDWDIVNTSEWHGNHQATTADTFDTDSRVGLGLALEAAVTGKEPPSSGDEPGRHSAAQARIMHDTINTLDYGHPDGRKEGGDRVADGDNLLKKDDFANIRGPLARALADYTPDMVGIVTGEAPGGRAGEENSLSAGNKSEIQNSRGSLLRIMRGVSEDSENYFLLREAEHRYMAGQLDSLSGQLDKESDSATRFQMINNRSSKIAEVFGTLDAIGGDIKLSERDKELSEAGDNRVYGYHLVGGLVTGIPLVGDLAQRTVDGIANEWLKALAEEKDLVARDDISHANDKGADIVNKFFASWGKVHDRTDTEVASAQRVADLSYGDGRRDAYEALRARK